MRNISFNDIWEIGYTFLGIESKCQMGFRVCAPFVVDEVPSEASTVRGHVRAEQPGITTVTA